jgi:hypothetical protein
VPQQLPQEQAFQEEEVVVVPELAEGQYDAADSARTCSSPSRNCAASMEHGTCSDASTDQVAVAPPLLSDEKSKKETTDKQEKAAKVVDGGGRSSISQAPCTGSCGSDNSRLAIRVDDTDCPVVDEQSRVDSKKTNGCSEKRREAP